MRKLFSVRFTNGSVNFSLLVIRLVFGILLMTHGWMKIENFSQMSGSFPDPFHVTSKISLTLVIFAEVFCAGLAVIGLFTRLAAIPVIICMCVIVFMIHGNDAVAKQEPGMMYLASFFVLLLCGPGRFSLDSLIWK
ncbi:DoxX family protein [Chitinophaga caeni]|nr:DoxX family protein [Chitinophaga caeni]